MSFLKSRTLGSVKGFLLVEVDGNLNPEIFLRSSWRHLHFSHLCKVLTGCCPSHLPGEFCKKMATHWVGRDRWAWRGRLGKLSYHVRSLKCGKLGGMNPGNLGISRVVGGLRGQQIVGS